MTRYKIILDRAACIGASPCVSVEGGKDIWKMDFDEGKVDMILEGATKTPERHEIIVEDEELVKKAIASGEICPVVAIKVINMDTGEDLVKQ